MPSNAVLNVGFQNFVLTEKIVALVNPDSAPMRRVVQQLKKSGEVIDVTHGRRTKSVVFLTTGGVVLSAISQETLAKRLTSADLSTGEDITDEE